MHQNKQTISIGLSSSFAGGVPFGNNHADTNLGMLPSPQATVGKLFPYNITLDQEFQEALIIRGTRLKTELIATIESFKDLSTGWDSYNAEPPNYVAIENALYAVDVLVRHSLAPSKTSPSAEAGIIFEFLDNGNYFLLEFGNEGDIVYLRRINDHSEAFDISKKDVVSKVLEIKYGV